jgi:hypothetical protein
MLCGVERARERIGTRFFEKEKLAENSFESSVDSSQFFENLLINYPHITSSQ